MDNRGHQADTEIAAYEIRLFCEMLLKGAVNIFEVNLNCSCLIHFLVLTFYV